MSNIDHAIEHMRRKARSRGARHMVMQGLALYHQALLHRLIDDTPSYFEQVMQRARGKAEGQRIQLRSARCN
jgi:hypothetical protein